MYILRIIYYVLTSNILSGGVFCVVCDKSLWLWILRNDPIASCFCLATMRLYISFNDRYTRITYFGRILTDVLRARSYLTKNHKEALNNVNIVCIEIGVLQLNASLQGTLTINMLVNKCVRWQFIIYVLIYVNHQSAIISWCVG